MKSRHIFAALAASAGLVWGSAQAAPEATEAPVELPPGIIIFELQPATPGEVPPSEGAPQAAQPSEHEQMMIGMLLLQMLSGMQAEAESVPVQQVPVQGERI